MLGLLRAELRRRGSCVQSPECGTDVLTCCVPVLTWLQTRRESSSSGSSEAATEHSDSSSVVTEGGGEDMPVAYNSSGGVATAGSSNWQASFQSLGLAQ